MRGHCVCLVAILTIVPSTVWAASDAIPTLGVRPVCRGIASQSADPGVGQRDQTETFKQCIENEQAVLEQLKQVWSAFSAADRRHCVTLATTGGESSNTELLTCLEMARDVRVPSTTLADLLTPLLDTNPFSTVRASFRWQLSDERDDGVADGRQAWLRRRAVDSFFPASPF